MFLYKPTIHDSSIVLICAFFLNFAATSDLARKISVYDVCVIKLLSFPLKINFVTLLHFT